VKERDLVLLEQVQNPVVVLLDHAILATQHPGQVETEALDFNAMRGKVMAGLLVMLRRLQQRLGGNAANIGAGSARCRPAVLVLPFVNAGRSETELGRADRGNVAPGPPR